LRNSPSDALEKYWDGEVTRWYSLEMVSFGGEIHYYIRTYYKQRDLVEAAFFSYYPDIEIEEVPDYIERLPGTLEELYAQGYDIWGTEMALAKPEAYPIKTYPKFEASEEEKEFDPASAFLEVLAKVKQEEMVGIQILIAPADNEWCNQYQDLVDELRAAQLKSLQKKKTKWDFSSGPLPALKEVGREDTTVNPELFRHTLARTPGETDVLEAVERNLSKPAFDTLIRFFYLSPKPLFYDSFARRGITGAFNQYSALNLNYFTQNWNMGTKVSKLRKPFVLVESRKEMRKRRLLYNYQHREMPPDTAIGRILTSHLLHWNVSKTFKMTTEAIATIFHPPTYVVLTAPHVPRVESKKGGPPAGIPIYGEESDVTQFQGEQQ
ncbi:hypothetical protein D6833_05105, partial [Candidatus Parcubacteria bacterium]